MTLPFDGLAPCAVLASFLPIRAPDRVV